jgi:hypothetical protein
MVALRTSLTLSVDKIVKDVATGMQKFLATIRLHVNHEISTVEIFTFISTREVLGRA